MDSAPDNCDGHVQKRSVAVVPGSVFGACGTIEAWVAANMTRNKFGS
ncbi:MAG: hypothetical protein K2I95_06000 [Treponemataceae bacterium]|nr:hypothetical protein [Treponemataceae bacterium]